LSTKKKGHAKEKAEGLVEKNEFLHSERAEKGCVSTLSQAAISKQARTNLPPSPPRRQEVQKLFRLILEIVGTGRKKMKINGTETPAPSAEK